MEKEKKKTTEFEVNPMINVTFGSWHFEGDFRLIPEVSEQIQHSIMPLFSEGNKEAIKVGLLLPVNDNNNEGYN